MKDKRPNYRSVDCCRFCSFGRKELYCHEWVNVCDKHNTIIGAFTSICDDYSKKECDSKVGGKA
jgi:hypothetical protein